MNFLTRAPTLAEININPLIPCLATLSHVLLFILQICKLALILITKHSHSLFKQCVWEVEFTRKNKYPIASKSLVGT